MNQMKMPLLEAMNKYRAKGVTPFDVPGHKRAAYGNQELMAFMGKQALGFDLNSLPELDNLNYPSGVIQESQQLLAEAYCADHAFFTVNGTTLSVHAMILSVCRPGDKILLPRNVHKSAINALMLCDAMPVYMQAEVSTTLNFATGITIETVKQSIFENPDAKAIFVINPTYYGICSDLKEIIEYAHSKNIAVIVDEAHGAHFGFHKELPKSAMEYGADMSAISIHKTGGALTQASALLLKGNRVKREHVQSILNILQTTSASYLLMTSLDIARYNLALHGEEVLSNVLDYVRKARCAINNINGLYAYGRELIGNPGIFDFDETKLGINVAGLGITGYEVYDILYHRYNIQMELADTHNVLAIVSLGDTKFSLEKLVNALENLAINYRKNNALTFDHVPLENPKVRVSPRTAFYADKELVKLEDSVGRIIAESVMVYPPGIPILAPGEEITKEIIVYLKFLKTQHTKLTDMNDKNLVKLLVIIT